MQKSILITGCSTGIGLYCALELQKRNYRVFATARKLEDVEKLKSKGLEALQLDVDSSDSIKNTLQIILEKTNGTLDAVFNNAGYAIAGAVEDITRDMMRTQFETNVFGTMELTNLIIPVMRKQGHGRIIQNTSILGVIPMAYRGAYCASKYALEGFSLTLRQELHGSNIHVSIIAPGAIRTQFRENAYKNFKKTLIDQPTVHKKLYNSMQEYFFAPGDENERAFTAGPDAVFKKLLNALESKNPKAHYFIGFPAQLFSIFRRILPDSLMEWVMLKVIAGEQK